MANTTLATLRDEVQYRLNRDGESGLPGRIDRRINWTNYNLAQLLYIPELEASSNITLVTGQLSYAGPSDLLAIRSMKVVVDRLSLRPIPLREAEALDESTQGAPFGYIRYGATASSNISIFAPPTSTYNGHIVRCRYQKVPLTLAADTDVNDLPPYCDEGVVLGAVYRMLRERNEPERANMAFRDWQGWIKSQRVEFAEELKYYGGKQLSTYTQMPLSQ
jgi:hypothetical protein